MQLPLIGMTTIKRYAGIAFVPFLLAVTQVAAEPRPLLIVSEPFHPYEYPDADGRPAGFSLVDRVCVPPVCRYDAECAG